MKSFKKYCIWNSQEFPKWLSVTWHHDSVVVWRTANENSSLSLAVNIAKLCLHEKVSSCSNNKKLFAFITIYIKIIFQGCSFLLSESFVYDFTLLFASDEYAKLYWSWTIKSFVLLVLRGRILTYESELLVFGFWSESIRIFSKTKRQSVIRLILGVQLYCMYNIHV